MTSQIPLSERIQKLIDFSKLSIPKFAVAVGAKTPQAIRELLKGNTKSLSENLSEGIMSYFRSLDKGWELNPMWLLLGEGEMMLPVHEAEEYEKIQKVPSQVLMMGLEDSLQIFSKNLISHITKLQEDLNNGLEERKQFLTLLNAQQQTINELRGELAECRSKLDALTEEGLRDVAQAPPASSPSAVPSDAVSLA